MIDFILLILNQAMTANQKNIIDLFSVFYKLFADNEVIIKYANQRTHKKYFYLQNNYLIY